MKLYEISNPSDAYTIRGEFKVASAAVLVLGEGRYGIHTDDKEDGELPLFIFGGEEMLETWLKEHGLHPFEEFLDKHKLEVADALDSVLIGDLRSRTMFENIIANMKDPVERAKARDTYHDEKRSSLNDIGGRAWVLAQHLRKRAEAPVEQVSAQ